MDITSVFAALTLLLSFSSGAQTLPVETAQWQLGKRAYLDWWIAGAGYGSSKGRLSGTAPLNEDAQGALKQELDALELPFVSGEAEVNAGGARMNLKGPWGDFRAGISLGIGF